MRKLVFLTVLLCAAIAAADVPDFIALEVTNVTQRYPTGVVVTTATSAPLDGYVEAIAIYAQSASTTCTVQLLVVTNVPYETPLTFYNVTNFSQSVYYMTRFPISDTNAVTYHGLTNAFDKVMLYQQKLILRAWGAWQPNKNIRAGIWLHR